MSRARWHSRLSRRGWYALGGLGLVVGIGALPFFVGPGQWLLALALLALGAAIAWLWSSLLALDSDTPLGVDEALAMVVPTVEEEKKQSVLRALKDLEYERAVGKISSEDFATLVAKYRREAKELLYVIDQGKATELRSAEAELTERLKAEGLLEAEPKRENPP